MPRRKTPVGAGKSASTPSQASANGEGGPSLARSTQLAPREVLMNGFPGCDYPLNVAFAARKSNYLAYLDLEKFSESPERQLMLLDINTRDPVVLLTPRSFAGGGDTEENLTLEEKLRRERTRTQTVGVSTFNWVTRETVADVAAAGKEEVARDHILFPLKQNWYLMHEEEEKEGSSTTAMEAGQNDNRLPRFKVTKIISNTSEEDRGDDEAGASPALDASLSPRGRYVSYVRNGALMIKCLDTGVVRAASPNPAPDGTTGGLASYLAQEEMDRFRGYWWSPDERWIAYEYVDERAIPLFRILHQTGPDDGVEEVHRYPFAGCANPVVELRLVDVEALFQQPASQQSLLLLTRTLRAFEGEYLARVDWLPDSSAVCVQVEDRAQMNLSLLAYYTGSVEPRLLLRESSEVWINLHHLFHPFLEPNTGRIHFLWGSERTRYQHLYLYALESETEPARLVRALTGGEGWVVETLAGVDPRNDLVYFMGNRESPIERHLYVARLGLTPAASTTTTTSSSSSSNGDAAAPSPPILRLTEPHGTHAAVLDPSSHSLAVITRSTTSSPTTMDVCKLPTPDRIHAMLASRLGEPDVVVVEDEARNEETGGGSPFAKKLRRAMRNSPSTATTRSKPHSCDESSIKCGCSFESQGEIDWSKNNQEVMLMGMEEGTHQNRLLTPIYALYRHSYTPTDSAAPVATSGASSSRSPLLPSLRPPRLQKVTIPPPPPSVDGNGLESAQKSEEEQESPLLRQAPNLLYSHVYVPREELFGRGPFPTVVIVYGGPHVQRVRDEWGAACDVRAQLLAAHGFLVVKTDNRGSSRRGLAFEGAVRRRFGKVEIDDQALALGPLVEAGLCDPARVGVTGWSFGGYLTLMGLILRPDVFRVGVSGAPVTSWDGYDTHYTERYMGTPQENPEGYAAASAVARAGGMRESARLLLVHGAADENVHFRHSLRMIEALVREGKPYDLLVFPDGRHGIRRFQDRVYLEERILAYFVTHLAAR